MAEMPPEQRTVDCSDCNTDHLVEVENGKARYFFLQGGWLDVRNADIPKQRTVIRCDGTNCRGHPLDCYGHPNECGCTRAGGDHKTMLRQPPPWPSDLAEHIVDEIGHRGGKTFAVGANLSRVAAIIRKHLEAGRAGR